MNHDTANYRKTAARLGDGAAILMLRMNGDVQGSHALIRYHAEEGTLEELAAAMADVTAGAIAQDAAAATKRGDDTLPSTQWIASAAAFARDAREPEPGEERPGFTEA